MIRLIQQTASVFFCFVALSHGQALGEVSGDLAALKLVAELYRANLARIETWQGSVRATQYDIKLGETVDSHESLVQFFLDVPGQRLCSLRTYLGTDRGSGSPVIVNGLVAGGRLTYRNETGPDVPIVQVRPFTEPLLSSTPVENCFNPLHHLPLSSQDFSAFFIFLFENAQTPSELKWVVAREDNIVTVGYTLADRRDRYVADLKQGGNLIKYEMLSDAADTIYEWEYESRSDVWVPKLYNYKDRRRFVLKDGKREVTKTEQSATVQTLELRDNQVNVPIPESRFTLTAIGVKEGDRIHD